MTETLKQFKNRVYGFEYNSIYLDEAGCFQTKDSLSNKIDAEGKMCPYIGNTMVFILNKNHEQIEYLRKRITWMQDILYAMCHKMLGERLQNHTLHMTLHDLKNGLPDQISEIELKSVGKAANEILMDLKKVSWKINLQTTCVFNMVNTSVVLGLEPRTDEDCRLLMELYEKFEEIHPLGYPLTPHITLAYYKPGVYWGDDIRKLEYVFEALSEEKLTVTFCAEDLIYQEFCDMNHYFSN
ncbi:MAG: hypothetical protein ACI4C1_06505 [Lachnospiraceae bacterium]